MSTKGNIENSEGLCFSAQDCDAPLTTASVTSVVMQEPVVLRVAIAATANKVKVSFDPVSIEENRQTRELNKSLRLGFMRTAASTR